MTNKRILTLITLLLFLLLVVGCDVIKPNQPPVITSDPVETATVGVDYTYNVVATDPNAGDVLTYSLATEPEGILIDEDSGVITWEADDITAAGVGDYDVVVVVSDEGGLSDSQEFTITVSEFVVELVGIEVDPEEMTLVVDGIETFEVTANYNDDSTMVVTSDCVYGIDDISIAEVHKEEGKVIALKKVGIAIISISYTEGGITKGTTLTVTVEGTITVRWLEDAVRFYADGSWGNAWQNDLIPPGELPATLILTGGEYHFADANEFYNYEDLDDFEGSAVIDGTGLLSGYAAYTYNELPTEDIIVGQVEIIINGEEKGWDPFPNDPGDYEGIMVGTYTQWSYKFVYDTEDLVILEDKYPKAILCEGSEDKWFVGHTEYIAHGWKELPLE